MILTRKLELIEDDDSKAEELIDSKEEELIIDDDSKAEESVDSSIGVDGKILEETGVT